MASESRQRLLPIPCCSREYRSTAHLQTARQSALAKRSGSSQPTRKEEVGVTDSGLQQVDTHTPNLVPLSSRPLPRHTSLIRAVCVDAHVRIRPGGRSVMSVPTGTIDTLWKIEGSNLSFTSWAATPAAQALRGGSTQRAGRSVLRYAR